METQNNRLLPTDRLTLSTTTNPFGYGNTVFDIESGLTVYDILKKHCPNLERFSPIIFVDDVKVPKNKWKSVKPKAGHTISVCATPMGGGGGKNPLATVLSIALLAAAPYVAGAASFALAGGMGPLTAGQMLVGRLIAGAVTVVGRMAITAIAPPPKPRAPDFQSAQNSNARDVSQTYYIQGARNRLSPFETVPELLGTHRIVPPMATIPYNEILGDLVYVRQMFLLTNGKLTVANEQLGETSLDRYDDIDEENFFNGTGADGSTLIPAIVNTDDFNVEVERDGDWFPMTTATDQADEVDVQISFPEGVVIFNNQGVRVARQIDYEIRYRLVGDVDWTTQQFTKTYNRTDGFVINEKFAGLTRGQYEFEIRNLSSGWEGARAEGRVRDQMVLTAFRSYTMENPVNDDDASFKAIRMLGTNQLNGAIDDYNLVGSRLLKDWNGTEWVADQPTSNPASIYLHLLQSPNAKTPIPDARIDWQRIQDWHEYCTSKGFVYNAYIDYDAERENLLREVCAAGMATPASRDNKYSVVVDNEKNTIVQHISQRNSYDYTYEKTFTEQIHGFRVPFINENKNYVQDEIIVYADGFNSTNATRLEVMDFPGVTNSTAIYKLARHRLAEIIHRPDMHKVNMDIEHTLMERGDRVKLSYDISLIGLGSGRVKSVIKNGTNVIGIVSDEAFPMISGKSYSIEYRKSNNQHGTVAIQPNVGDENTTLMFLTAVSESNAPDVGDLFSFGETGSVTIDALVHSISPLADEHAEIKLVNYAPEIFTASDGPIPEYNNNITIPYSWARPKAPELLSVLSDESVQIRNIDGSISSRMVINLNNLNTGSVEPIVEIRQITESTYRPADTIAREPNRVVIEGLTQGEVYDIKIRYRRVVAADLIGNANISSALLLNGITFIGEGSPPPDVDNFDLTVRGESVMLTWDAVTVIDMSHYELRFQPVTTGAQWQNGIPLNANIPPSQTSISVPSAIGTYMIRAVDNQNNRSANASFAVTSVGKLLALNVVETINEHSTWSGTKSNVTVGAGALRLAGSDTIDDWTLVDSVINWDLGESGIAATGTYTFADTTDLGAVYDNVVSANLSVGGENVGENIDEWTDVDERGDWDGANPDEYSITLQIRTTSDDPAATPTWSAWQNLKPLGEYTARAFQFRLILATQNSNITPVISQCSITIDMPDRIVEDRAISSGTGGYTVTYDEPFRVTPTLGVTASNLDSGERMVISNETENGFTVEFFQGATTSIDRTFSYIAKGYGRSS